MQVSAASRHDVVLWDMTDTLLDKARAHMAKSLARVAAKKFKDAPAEAEAYQKEVLARVTFTTDQEAAVKDADLVLEVGEGEFRFSQHLTVLCSLYLTSYPGHCGKPQG